MKNFRKNILFSVVVILTGLTSCFDEKDEDYTIVGPVGTAAIITTAVDQATKVEKVITEASAGEEILVNVRYYSEYVAVKQVRLSVTIGSGTASELWTMEVTDFDTNNSYERKIGYVMPVAPSKTQVKFTAEVLTENELTYTRNGTVIMK